MSRVRGQSTSDHVGSGTARRPIVAVIGAAMLFGTAGTAQELGPSAATPLGVSAVRIAIGTCILWLAIAFRRAAPRRATLRAQWRLFLVGGAGVATYSPMFMSSVDRTGVAVGTVVAIGSGPFFAGALEWAWRGVRPGLGWLIGTLVTVSGGVVLVVAQSSAGSGESAVDTVGVLFALVAGAGYALYSVTAKVTIADGVDSTVALAVPFTVGSVAVALMALGEPFEWLATRQGLWMAFQLGILATGLAYLLYGFGLQRLTSATTVTLVLAEPLTATALAAVVLDESIVAVAWIGIAVLCAGLLVVGRTAEVA